MAEEVYGIPIHVHNDMPVGCMIVVSGDGRQVIPIVNLDIEVCGTLPPGPPQIEYGSRTVTGEFTANFEVDNEAYAKFISGISTVGRHAMEAIVKLGDAFARSGALNRSGRKQWRKDRKRLVANMRRSDARANRGIYGLATF